MVSLPLWKRNLYVSLFGAFATTAGLSLVLPFLPLYIESLGVSDPGEIMRWSGYAFAATFLTAAIASPIWGRLADMYGRKPMLIRASLGMSVVMTLIGLAQSPWQVVLGRLVMGGVAGYVTAAIILVATQTPQKYVGWALGLLSSASVAGTLVGPLLGGWLADVAGLRYSFFVTSAFLFFAFLVTWFFIEEAPVRNIAARASLAEVWRTVRQKEVLVAMGLTSFMFQVANMSIEPIVTIYIKSLSGNSDHLALIAGVVVSAPAFAGMLSAPLLGRMADRYGAARILCICLLVVGASLIPQAWVRGSWGPWQLTLLRFIMGLALAGLMPAISTLVKGAVPEASVGRMFGYMQSAQFLGEVVGPVMGGHLAADHGMGMAFYSTAALMVLTAMFAAFAARHVGSAASLAGVTAAPAVIAGQEVISTTPTMPMDLSAAVQPPDTPVSPEKSTF